MTRPRRITSQFVKAASQHHPVQPFDPVTARFSRKAAKRSQCTFSVKSVFFIVGCIATSCVACLSAYNFGLLVGQVLSGEQETSAIESRLHVKDAPISHAVEVRLPNVLLVGAQKTGSTALATLLYRSGVCRPEVLEGEPSHFRKEVHFFDRDQRYKNGPSFYARRFRHCADWPLVMDATPAYLSFPERVRATYDAVGDDQADRLKIMMILRDPVARELSVYNHKVYMHENRIGEKMFGNDIAEEGGNLLSFEEYADRTLEFINPNGSCREEKLKARPYFYQNCFGLYASHLKRWMTAFNSSNILVLSYEELVRDEEQFKWRVHSFLGFDKELVLEKMERVNLKKSEHKLDFPSCPVQSKLASAFRPTNEELYNLLRTKRLPTMEQRPFPEFVISNCTADSSHRR